MGSLKIQVLVLLIALVIGVTIGANLDKIMGTEVDVKAHEKKVEQLEKSVENLMQAVKERDRLIILQDSLALADKTQIKILEIRYKQVLVEGKKEREVVNKLPTHEKVTWIYRYFNLDPK